jgi:hypothetical protein
MQFLQSQATNPAINRVEAGLLQKFAFASAKGSFSKHPNSLSVRSITYTKRALKYRNAQRAFDVVAANLPL